MPIRWERASAEQLIHQLYRSVFERPPEPTVLRGLIAYLTEGRVSVRMQFMRMLKSDEFFDKNLRGKTPEGVARELYRCILARPAESSDALKDAADFVGNLGWRVQVDVMINSEEYLGRFGDDVPPGPRVAG
jgi:Phycobilisome Linker polypeptide